MATKKKQVSNENDEGGMAEEAAGFVQDTMDSATDDFLDKRDDDADRKKKDLELAGNWRQTNPITDSTHSHETAKGGVNAGPLVKKLWDDEDKE
jgi:hypothetical protein